jgi:hypothetical protein
MNDVRTRLDVARRQAPDVPADLRRLYGWRRAKERRRRVAITVIALVIGVAPIAVALGTIARHGRPYTVGRGAQMGVPSIDLTLAPGEYYYVRIEAADATYETWWALDDSGRIRGLDGVSLGDLEGTYAPGAFASDSGPVADLSTDPAELIEQLRERVGNGGASPEPYRDWGGPVEWGLIVSITELLEAPDVPPAQKAALMSVAADLDGIEVDPRAHDPTGRAAILLTSEVGHATHRWWFDPESHQPLAIDNGGGLDVLIQAAGVTASIETTRLERTFVTPPH